MSRSQVDALAAVRGGPVIVLNMTAVLLPFRPGETVSVAPPVDNAGVKVAATGPVTVTTLNRPLLPLAVVVVRVMVAGVGLGRGWGSAIACYSSC